MATPSKIRKAIRETLVKTIRIDKFGLNKPESIRDITKPPSVASEGASGSWVISEILGSGSGSTFNLKTTLSYEVLFRLDNSYKYTDIDRGLAEGIGLLFCIQLKQSPECLDPSIIELEPSMKLIIQEETNNDWLVVFQFDIDVVFEVLLSELKEEVKVSVYTVNKQSN